MIISYKEIEKFFEKYGKIKNINIPNYDTNKLYNQGYCFITFSTKEEVDNVFKNLPLPCLKGCPLVIKKY